MLQWINHNNRKFLKTTAIWGMAVVFFVFLFSFTPVHAQTAPELVDATTLGNEYAGQIGLTGTDIRLIIANIIRAALGLLGLVMVILMLYAGFIWMTAGGNDDQIVKAKSIIKNAIIGLAIILASYSIVWFVMNLLGIGKKSFGDTIVDVTGPNTHNFQGSGALGTVIKDHYPMRNQEDVSRNTKIVVTFRRPVLLSSFVDDTSGNGILGDCKETVVKWSEDCDQLKKGADGKLDNNLVNISQITKNGDLTELLSFPAGVSVLATSTEFGGVKGIYTVVFRPNEYLGSSTEKYTYVVRLGRNILLDDAVNKNPSAFSVKILGNDYYEWQFSCSTLMDFSPPRVVSVYPGQGQQDFMNTALQIHFSEAMDPTGLQGAFFPGTDGSYYVLQGGTIFLKTAHSNLPAGSFNIVNNYKTLEFIPSQECPKENTCGGKMYCMNVCDKNKAGCADVIFDGANFKNEDFQMVVKAATVIKAGSFEANAFTGAMDMSGNALDSDPYGVVNTAKTDPTVPAFFANNPDNYFWSFKLADKMYDTPPSLRQVMPGLDAGQITARQEWKMEFAGVMLAESLYSINIVEEPVQTPSICKVPQAIFNIGEVMADNTTLVKMSHCPFLDGKPMYYLPVLTSDLMEVHFNCFNPGQGPGDGTRGVGVEMGLKALESSVCDKDHPANCCAVDATGKNEDKIFCCNGKVVTKNESTNCVNTLKTTPPVSSLSTTE